MQNTTHQTHRRQRRLRYIATLRPTTPDALHAFVRRGFGLDVGRVAIAQDSTPPFAYLQHAFFHGHDCVVWANRGGGKTMLGAVATLLDLLFKPGIQVRILGGSLEQSSKMYDHLRSLLDRPLLRDPSDGCSVLARPATGRRVELVNGSVAEVLAGSQRSVRGTRVHKLRCDEVEEFDPAVWDAAQLVTRSGTCGTLHVPGGVEALSTLHRPFGLMSQLVHAPAMNQQKAQPTDTRRVASRLSDNPTTHHHADAEPRAAKRLVSPVKTFQHPHPPTPPTTFRWNALDVSARCPPSIPCDTCVLWDDCGGRAKLATGFVPIDDLIAQRRRTSDRTWSAEMMCRRPTVTAAVYPDFDPSPAGPHVAENPFPQGENDRWVGGVDFGIRSPLVMLWARVQATPGEAHAAQVHIVDEYLAEGLTIDRHLAAIDEQRQRLGLPPAEQLDFVGVDPAGHQRNSHTGRTDIALVRDAGYRVRATRSRLAEGIEIVRRRLDRGTLVIHPRCEQLIRSLQAYRFDPDRPHRDDPLKDGPDHACDALRYLLLNLERGVSPVIAGSYLAGASRE
ncbi:MAG: hypothetical protein AAGA25_07870 [Planctomycetota bacterium]